MAEENGAHADAPAANNRKSFRSPVKIIAELFVSEGVRFRVDVLDLSPTGFRIQTANHIPLNRRVYLTIPGLRSLPARIAWNDRENYGCEFSVPLHGAMHAHLSGRFPALFK